MAVSKAKDFLESSLHSVDDPYTTALSAYTLALLRSPYAPLALRRLNHMAITQGTAAHLYGEDDRFAPPTLSISFSMFYLADFLIHKNVL